MRTHVYKHICMHIYIHIYSQAANHKCIYRLDAIYQQSIVHMYMYIYIYIYVYIYIRIYIHTCVYNTFTILKYTFFWGKNHMYVYI